MVGGLLGEKKTPSPAKKVTITNISLRFMGKPHGIAGMEVTERVFELHIPFQNKMGSDLLPDNLRGPPIVLNSITVTEPFKLVDVDPKLPVEVPYMSKTRFTLRISAPDMAWEGPLSISFGNEPANNVAINVRRVVLHYEGRSAELEESSIKTSMQKSQLFKQSLQLYQILSLGDTVSKVEVNAPFEIVSTDPKLPIKADKKDSYIMSIYMKCPESSYSGDLDIKFS